ncbi:MAG: cation-translocating P-type ATPase [Steroidobacteraceae bacterium]
MSGATSSGHAVWRPAQDGEQRVLLAVQGMRCAVCARSVQSALAAVPGVLNAEVNAASHKASVRFDAARTAVPELLRAVSASGFSAEPLAGSSATAAFARERRRAIKRIGLAGLGMMQVGMYLSGMYFASTEQMGEQMTQILRIAGLVITTPVLLYSGQPFLSGAWQALRHGRASMDVTVALALVLAYLASIYNTVTASGDVYFDSIAMFIFFLSLGRYAEMLIRHGNLSAHEALSRTLPATVLLVADDGTTSRVNLAEVKAGMRLRIPAGAVVPVDGELLSASAALDESLLTGESLAVARACGETIYGGSINAGNACEMLAHTASADTRLAGIAALLESALNSRPRVARLADSVASWFILGVLVIAASVAVAWLYVDATRVLPIVLSVLVVSCPCALSLATPAAIAAAGLRLTRNGVLITQADAIERLAGIDTVVLDKTGTLTSGEQRLAGVEVLGSMGRERSLAIAGALEAHSSHPLARAFAVTARGDLSASAVEETPGQGISGVVDGERYWLGRWEFLPHGNSAASGEAAADLWLGDARGACARFTVEEQLRDGTTAALTALRARGIDVVMASGDSERRVTAIASQLAISNARARLDPTQKMELVRELRANGRHVLALGDGINDGPFLASADVGFAVGSGSALAQAASDLLLLGDTLEALPRSIDVARHTVTVIKQNLGWALGYNLAAIPAAALGLVPPWLAALGMSMSSLLVALNARRLAN